MKKEDPEHIGSILEQLFRNPEWKDKLQASLPLLRWQEIVGDKIARQSQPESLKDGVLEVKVANSAWLHHLRFLEGDLRHKLNKELPTLEIKELRFRQGSLEEVQPAESSASTEQTPAPHNHEEQPTILDPQQLRLLQSVADPELRRDLESLLRRQLARSRT
jgi:predicted nucleic acid-binding Zn ribbon protein